MNKRKAGYAIIIVVSLLAFSALFFAYDSVYRNKTSTANEISESATVAAPEFSKISGFYSNPFYLRISVPKGTKVYYTLDGTDPDENSSEYTEPLYLEDATAHENVYSMRTDVSTGFYTDLIEKYQTVDKDPHYKAPDYQLDKCNVVKAISVDKNGNKSDITTASYFVGISPKKYNGCNVVSLVSDPYNLFDYNDGIYVTGSTFDKYSKNSKFADHWRLWKANYKNKGKKWERTAYLEFFSSNGKLLLSKNGGMRIQGGISRGMLPRSLNLYSREKYDGSETFSYEFFKDDKSYLPHIITLSSGGNQTITQFDDVMMTDRVKSLNFTVMDFEPYVLFIDGEYWGFYRLSSKFDEYFISYKYGIDKDNVAIIKNGALECGESSSLNHYQQMKSFITDNDMKDGTNYSRACEYIDINSFIDYYATQIYTARQNDWPSANFALWRTVEAREGKYSDGKWRWILFDSNSTSMESRLVNDDSIAFVIENDEIFASLWENADFKKAFETRILEIADECFDAKEMDEYIDNYTEQMYPIMSPSWERFYGKDNNESEEYYELMNGHKEFFEKRKAVVESWFTEN